MDIASQFFTQQVVDDFSKRLIELNGGVNPFGSKDIRIFNADMISEMTTSRTEKELKATLSDIVCNGCINSGYVKRSVDLSLGTSDKFDMIIIAEFDPIWTEFKVYSFIVVEIGECRLHAKAAAVKLICSQPKSNMGKFSMAAFLFAILSHPSLRQEGVLELASGYNNAPGLCLYQKFGFQPDFSLFDAACFNNASLLPMRVKLDEGVYASLDQEERKNLVINVALQKANAMATKHPVCNVRSGQAVLAFLTQYFILMRRDNSKNWNKQHEIATRLADKTGLYNEEDLESLRQYLLRGNGNKHPAYFENLSHWLTEKLVDAGALCADNVESADASDLAMSDEMIEEIRATEPLTDVDEEYVGLVPDPAQARTTEFAKVVEVQKKVQTRKKMGGGKRRRRKTRHRNRRRRS